MSPTLTNNGTCTTAPVSSVAGLVTFETVSPFTPGSVSRTARSTAAGSCSDDGLPSTVSNWTVSFSRMKQVVVHRSRQDLVERLGVHQVDVVAVVVGVPRVTLFTSVRMRGIFSPARNVLSLPAALQRLQLGAHERAALARLDVLELDDAEHLPVDLDVHPVLELVGGNRFGHVLQLVAMRSLGYPVSRSQPSAVTITRSPIRTPPTPGR